MDRMTKTLYLNIAWVLPLAYGCIFISLNLIRPDVDAFSFSEGTFIALFLMWFPLLSIIAIGTVYSFSMFDDEHKYARVMTTSSLLILAVSVAVLFIPNRTFYVLPVNFYNIILLVLFSANEIIHTVLLLRLGKNGFSIGYEAKMLKKIVSRQTKLPSTKWGKMITCGSFAFIVPFIFPCSWLVFMAIELTVAFALLYPLIMLTKAYTAMKDNMKLRFPLLPMVLFYFFVATSVFLFKISSGLSFLAIMTSVLPKYMVDNKIARSIYAEIKCKNGEFPARKF